MEKLNFTVSINASSEKVWQILWNDVTYRKWTSAFHEGSYAVSEWKERSKIQFLSPDGSGMYSIIDICKPNEFMAFKHLGVVKNFMEQPNDEETKAWSGGMETYSLKEENGTTLLECSLDSVEQFKEYFQSTFPKAMALLKDLAEQSK
jgi:hypothetical protein